MNPEMCSHGEFGRCLVCESEAHLKQPGPTAGAKSLRDRRNRLIENYTGFLMAAVDMNGDGYSIEGAVKRAIAIADAVIDATSEKDAK